MSFFIIEKIKKHRNCPALGRREREGKRKRKREGEKEERRKVGYTFKSHAHLKVLDCIALHSDASLCNAMHWYIVVHVSLSLQYVWTCTSAEGRNCFQGLQLAKSYEVLPPGTLSPGT